MPYQILQMSISTSNSLQFPLTPREFLIEYLVTSGFSNSLYTPHSVIDKTTSANSVNKMSTVSHTPITTRSSIHRCILRFGNFLKEGKPQGYFDCCCCDISRAQWLLLLNTMSSLMSTKRCVVSSVESWLSMLLLLSHDCRCCRCCWWWVASFSIFCNVEEFCLRFKNTMLSFASVSYLQKTCYNLHLHVPGAYATILTHVGLARARRLAVKALLRWSRDLPIFPHEAWVDPRNRFSDTFPQVCRAPRGHRYLSPYQWAILAVFIDKLVLSFHY